MNIHLVRAGLASFVLAGSLSAQIFGDHDLDPKTYASPSGTVTLSVDPSRRSGAGPATYRCARGAAELWAGERPWALWDAVVTDDGVVAGYAYGAGYRGGRDDSFTIVVLGPDGSAWLEQRMERKGFLSDMGMPDPLVDGLLLDTEGDRVIVRVGTGSWAADKSWWTYSLSSGAVGARIDPKAALPPDPRLFRLEEARLVPETGLALVRWRWVDWDAHQDGAVFALLDREGHSRWRLDWPRDYEHEDAQLTQELWTKGAILATAPGRFTLRQVAKNEQVTFTIDGSDVREVERRPYAPPVTEHEPESPAIRLDLRHLGTVSLASPAPASAIHDVMSFRLDDLGRPGILRRTGDRFDFVRVDRDGSNAREVELPAAPEGSWWTYQLAWCRGERWVVTATSDEAKGAWWVDADRRVLTSIGGFVGPEIDSLAGTPDGGFVALGNTTHGAYITNDLVAYGPDGGVRFTLGGDQGNPRDPSTLFAPTALEVLADGRIVILGNIQHLLQFFSASGAFERAVDLEKAWGRKPNYPTGIHRDAGGGLIVHDFNGKPPIVRIDLEGVIASGFQPRFADGGAFRPRSDVQAAPDGTLWTSDGQALLRLDAEGVVRKTLGAAPDTANLGRIARLALGPGDRIYAADRRTGAVHVFGPDGTRERVCAPAPGDFAGELSLPSLTVTRSGEVYLDNLHFAADGARICREDLPGSKGFFHAFAQPGSDQMWVFDGDRIHLLGPDRTPLRTIERTPEDLWLHMPGPAAVAPDGALAVATGAYRGIPSIHLYTSSGEPVRSIPQPKGMAGWAPFAFDGKRLAIGVQRKDEPGSVVLLDDQGNSLGNFTPPGETRTWIPYLAAKGAELWLLDMETSRIERYGMP